MAVVDCCSNRQGLTKFTIMECTDFRSKCCTITIKEKTTPECNAIVIICNSKDLKKVKRVILNYSKVIRINT